MSCKGKTLIKMILLALLFTILSLQSSVRSFELNSIFGRTNCFTNEQPNCSKDFIEAYPELSKSAINLTDAETRFLLFTRRNRNQPEKLHKCAGKLPPTTQFDPSEKLIVIVNPFAVGLCDVAVYREWLYQILKRGNYNVLLIDYSWGNHADYKTAIENIKIVAKQNIVVLNNIEERMGDIHITIIGHSLGAHLAGLTGQGIHVDRIIGLDPAGPGFDAKIVSPDDRLDRSDADLVEVWFCNAGSCLPYFGTPYLIGHVHFYINGGKVQKSCHKYSYISLMKGDFIYGFGTSILPTLCYHAQCSQYFKVAINPGDCKFVAVRCSSYSDFNAGKCKCGLNGHNCIVMGFDTEKYIEGEITSPQTYYVNTTDICPYCDKNPSYLGDFTDPYP